METYEVKPIFYNRDSSDFELEITAPGSKSITNRALMLAALSDGTTVLHGALFSDDSRHFLQCLKDLGFEVIIDEPACTVTVTGLGGRLPISEASIYVGSAGTAARFLTAMLGCAPGTWHLDASAQMKRRPMAPLIAALRGLGCQIVCQENEGFFPFTIISQGIQAGETTIDIGDSSQFLSALLMTAVMLDHDFDIHITGTHGLSYIDMTMKMMQQFGAAVSSPDGRNYHIEGSASYRACDYQIEPDASAAAYFYAMAALSGGNVRVNHVKWDSLQGDVELLHVFERMGCRTEEEAMGIRLYGPAAGQKLHGLTIDMGSFSDQALTIAAVAPFADSDVRICNVGHIRLQECDRMKAIVDNLDKLGIQAIPSETDILIHPGQVGAKGNAQIETFEDHRVAMAFSLSGLRVPGVVIENPMCCRKTFENYFEILEGICEGYAR